MTKFILKVNETTNPSKTMDTDIFEICPPIWKDNLNGEFFIKSTYCVDQNLRFGHTRNIWKWLWNGKVYPRLAVLLWRILNEAIPIRSKFPFSLDNECLLCGVDVETCLYVFRDRSMAKALWLLEEFLIFNERIPGTSVLRVCKKPCLSFPLVNSNLMAPLRVLNVITKFALLFGRGAADLVKLSQKVNVSFHELSCLVNAGFGLSVESKH
ncbi:hypothetical protein F8388_013597 [Cannabis sativa]|uniref:Reverse transcriptase zinc-binding domain-containing protein n=1 Tax=Cannabis sativa TaxID=3483 RepID=A0A7J6GB72_CANSA|nr:hypothetical protein F8388_013597 [Cannabis sativa]